MERRGRSFEDEAFVGALAVARPTGAVVLGTRERVLRALPGSSPRT
jgi:hypothetical protein